MKDQLAEFGIYHEQTFQRSVEHALLRQEALRTGIAQMDETEVRQYLKDFDQQPKRKAKLMRVMHNQP